LHEWGTALRVTEDEQLRWAKFQTDFFSVAGVIDPSEDQQTC
jgi:hypothetical protein